MVNTKRILTIVLAMTMTVGALAGCASSQKEGKDEQGRTVISVGNWPSKEGDALTLMNNRKAEFEEENPTMSVVPDTWKFDVQTFYSKAAAGQLPDLYYSNYTEVEKIIKGDYGVDLTAGLKRAGYEDSINDAIMKIISDGKKIYTFPTSAYCVGLAYNADLFRQAGLMNADGTPQVPQTWDEVVEFGKKITEATGKTGFAIPTSGNAGGWLFTPIAWSFGVDFMEQKEDGSWEGDLNSDAAVAALSYIKDLKWKHGIFGNNSLIDYSEYFKQFAIGNIGMIICAPDFPNDVKKYEMPLENMGMMPIPAGPKRHVSLTGGYAATVAPGATEDQVDVAIKWLEKCGYGIAFNDTIKATMEEDIKVKVANGDAIGLDGLSPFNDSNEIVRWKNELRIKYMNMVPEQIKPYNDSLKNSDIEYQPEEPVCAQELYAILDNCIQEVLTNENADVKALLDAADHDFQVNYLNNANY